jgi:hypothetical protein
MNSSSIIPKIWSHSHVLRDAGVSYGGRWRKFSYGELVARDKASLDIFWLRDQSLTDLDNLPDPDVLALEIIESIEAALEDFRAVAAALEGAP